MLERFDGSNRTIGAPTVDNNLLNVKGGTLKFVDTLKIVVDIPFRVKRRCHD